jgi:hypothetical protein
METVPQNNESPSTPPVERLAYSIQEAADMLGVNYFSIYRLIQRGKLKTLPCVARQAACAAIRIIEAAGNPMRRP